MIQIAYSKYKCVLLTSSNRQAYSTSTIPEWNHPYNNTCKNMFFQAQIF